MSSSSKPKGCFLSEDGHVYFNTHQTGAYGIREYSNRGRPICAGGTDSAHVNILDGLRMCLAFDKPQSRFDSGGEEWGGDVGNCEYCPQNSDNLPRAMMSMIKVGDDGIDSTEFRDSGAGIYSGSPGCADTSYGNMDYKEWTVCAAKGVDQCLLTFESPNFKETVNGKTPKAYVEEMQQRIRVDGFSAKVCEAKLTAQGVGATPAKTACAGQREIPDHCGEACPENMECKYDAITTFANTCMSRAVFLSTLGTNVCPAGSVSVFDTEAECTSAATTLGYGFGAIPLLNLGPSGCTASKPCEACQGDCDSDNDCNSGLKCYQRSKYDQVPGCAAGPKGPSGYDYCQMDTTQRVDSLSSSSKPKGCFLSEDGHVYFNALEITGAANRDRPICASWRSAKQAAATAAIMSLCSTGLLSPGKPRCCPGSCSQCGGSGCGSAGQGCCPQDSWSTCVEPDDTKCFMPTA